MARGPSQTGGPLGCLQHAQEELRRLPAAPVAEHDTDHEADAGQDKVEVGEAELPMLFAEPWLQASVAGLAFFQARSTGPWQASMLRSAAIPFPLRATLPHPCGGVHM